MTVQHNKRVGAHDVVGGGGNDGGGDSGGGSWSSEVGHVPPLMPGMAAPATVPAPGGFDDAKDAPMVIGGRRRQGWGGATTATAEQPPIGGAAGNDGATAAAATTIAAMTTMTMPISERERITHHWTMVGGRGSGG